MSDRIIDIWRRGSLLTDAVWYFASSRLKAEHRAARRMPTHLQQVSNNNPPMSGSEAFQETAKQAHQLVGHISSQAEVREKMRYELFDKLTDRQLVAYGFPVENDIAGDQLSEIPPYMFDLRFADWKNSTLKGVGHEFVSVRVVRVPRAQSRPTSADGKRAPAIPPPKAPGPRSQRDRIFEAIRALYARGVGLDSCVSKQVGPMVREYIADRLGQSIKVRGLSDETIRRVHNKYKEHLNKR